MADVRLAMEGAFETTVRAPADSVAVPQPWHRPGVAVAAFMSTVLVTGLAVWSLVPPASRPITRALLTPPPSMPLNIAIFDVNVALTPDGTRVVYRGLVNGQPHLFVRPLAALGATPFTL